MKKFTFLMSFIFAAILSSSIVAQTVVFSEDFEDQNAASRFTKVELGGSNIVDMAYAYDTTQTPAPNGGKYCAKIAVNTSEGVVSFAGILPKGKSFKGNYTLTFNAYFHWGTDPKYTTEFLYYGVGHGESVTAPPADGLDFAITGDNGSSKDRRLYKDGTLVTDLGLYTDSTENQDEFYNKYLDPIEVGPGTVAKPCKQWLKVSVAVTDSGVFYKIGNVNKGDTVWAHFDKDVLPVDGNIIIGYTDIFKSVSSDGVYLLVDNIVVTKPGATTGIGKNAAENPVSIYPNPVRNKLNVVVKIPSTFELYNIEGQLVRKVKVERSALVNVSDLTKGLYIAKITDKNGIAQTKKVLVK